VPRLINQLETALHAHRSLARSKLLGQRDFRFDHFL
jgi:hypothetical protein